ncbi:hypothetical protein [Novipirellula artificiosorum]|uniref:Uncharacterized protein n=1 Tax=Novipirellula artificiosorum TaxID=2528016 RepID=A0A5C6DIN6_9BACT|nr:hypothetical protein [Novipirellula artificiosorum]TWU35954.1 hypothetical protein Poly41_37060 [Novipirellula artificiosorum]
MNKKPLRSLQDDPDDELPDQAGPSQSIVQVPSKPDQHQIAQFITTIKNAPQQVGEHIIAALQHENTVAVITTVAIGPDGQQRVISAALNPARLEQVQEILEAAVEEREEEEPCVGFHCLVKPKRSTPG